MNTYTLITGASSGIGKAYAYEYAKRHQNLILVARSQDKLQALATELQTRYHIIAEVITIDLSQEYAAELLHEEIIQKEFLVDTLVNNAGFATKGLFTDIDYQRQHQEMLLNVVTLTELAYYFAKDMKERTQGTIINIASAASFNPLPYSAVYAATKAYVLSFSESLHYEYKNYNVKVLAVCPGATDTHFFDHFGAVTKKLRKPEDVVHTSFKGLKKNKIICCDGLFCKVQVALHRITTRKFAVHFMGRTGRKTWGKK